MQDYLFTSESVSEGHPDKIADQISDAILDAILTKDTNARVAAETLVTTGMALVAGEVTANHNIDVSHVVREVVKDIGYDSNIKGFDYNTCSVLTSLDRQSPDIARGVDSKIKEEQGAGDQGMMFGYAINETESCMPLSISLAHDLVKNLAYLRKCGKLPFVWPDSKSQVTIQYKNGIPQKVDTIVISTQHSPEVTQVQLTEAIMEELIKKVVPLEYVDKSTKYHINPTGRFVVGGPQGDCGLTGRKIIVDTYGGHGSHGGGAFSGKDSSKVDRSAAYAARHIAKNIVAAGIAKKCLVQIAYAIGVSKPVSVMVNDFGTSEYNSENISLAVQKIWDLRPAKIIDQFDLCKPRFRKTATYGHFGRDEVEFTWEKLDKIDQLKETIKSFSNTSSYLKSKSNSGIDLQRNSLC